MKTQLLFFVLLVAWPIAAAEFHVSPNGAADGEGSTAKPWNLVTALTHPAKIQPGDTIWLHGGEYRGSFESKLTGSAEAPILVRQAPGERARIFVEQTLLLKGEFARYQGFEVLCDNPVRTTELKGPWPKDLQRGGVDIRGDHIEAVNLIVHDLGLGFGFWREGKGGEIYGCLIYHNGWVGPDRPHGHGIYTQNLNGIKKITDCLIFRQFGGGIHVYGSGASSLRGYRIQGVASFQNGGRSFLLGGGAPLDDVVIENCFTHEGGLQLGYAASAKNKSAIARNNYFAGGIKVQYPGQVALEGNTIVTSVPVSIQLSPEHDLSGVKIDRNHYHKTEAQWKPFSILAPDGNRAGSIEMMREAGFDANSTFAEGPPTEARVFVRPNRFESGRGHIVIYNWASAPSIDVDLSEVVQKGHSFRVMHSLDYFGEPVAAGVYDGKPVTIPMTPRKAVSPIGLESQPRQTDLEFGAFVVLSAPPDT